MLRNRQTTLHTARTIEVGRTHVRLAVLEPRQDGPALVRLRAIQWEDAASGEEVKSCGERLAAALGKLTAGEKLSGQKVRFLLSGEFCTTRAIAGKPEQLQRTLEDLRERSRLYVGLGPGQKTFVSVTHAVDPRHPYAQVAVARTEILDAILVAAAEAGLAIESIEPSMVALARAVARVGGDPPAPQLAVRLLPGGLEMAICHDGELKLDCWRRSSAPVADSAELVTSHLKRLRRYCGRFRPLAEHDDSSATPLASVCLIGPPDAVAVAGEGLLRAAGLRTAEIPFESIGPEWRVAEGEYTSEFLAVLGAFLPPAHTARNGGGPDFLAHVRGSRREKLLPRLIRWGWPAAVAGLLLAALSSLNAWERSRCDDLERQVEELEPALAQIGRLRSDILAAESKAARWRELEKSLPTPPWPDAIQMIARCMPENVWLTRLEGRSEEGVQLVGHSPNDEGPSELVRWLNAAPQFRAARLDGVHPQQLPSGPAIGFDVKLEFVKRKNTSK